MLSPQYLINHIDPLTVMYSDLHTSILESIARHIADTLRATGTATISPSAAYQIERLSHAGLLEEEIISRIAEINQTSHEAIRELFTDAAIQTMIPDNKLYEAAGLGSINIKQSPEMMQILNAGINKTNGSIDRLTGSIATNSQEKFDSLLNLGYNKLVSGAFSYTEAINSAVDDLAREGVTAFSYASGRNVSIESAVRMNILTGANQTAAEITRQSLVDMGVSLVRTSAHLGARNKDVAGKPWANHESWQGQIYKYNEIDRGAGL